SSVPGSNPGLSAKSPPRPETARAPSHLGARVRVNVSASTPLVPLLLHLERDPGGLRGLVVLRLGLRVLAGLVESPGLRRDRPGIGCARVEAVPDRLVDLSL